jgi:hypothetical protein
MILFFLAEANRGDSTMLKKITGLLGSLPFFLTLLGGCQSFPGSTKTQAPPLIEVQRMVVLGFQPGLPPGQGPVVIQSPLTGSVFLVGQVSKKVYSQLTDQLYDKLLKECSFPLVSPEEAEGAFSNLKNSFFVEKDIVVFQQVGETLSCDAVLAGLVFRWQERIGNDYAVSQPASVAFELALIKTRDGTIAWTGRFDMTQASLTENVLDLDMFLKAKGRWMTAEELAEVGLSKLVKELPVEKKD